MLTERDWDAAGHAYAAEHRAYYEKVRAAVSWFTLIFLQPGPEADALRARVLPQVESDPSVLPDTLVTGPDLAPPTDEHRSRIFGSEQTRASRLTKGCLREASRTNREPSALERVSHAPVEQVQTFEAVDAEPTEFYARHCRLSMAEGTIFSFVCAIWLTCGVQVQAAIGARLVEDANPSAPAKLRIDNIRLESPPPETPMPATLLKFDMLNEGASSVTDISLEVSIVQRPTTQEAAGPSRVIVGPFTIRGHATVEAGYTVNYQLLLRNLASDCDCTAKITVVSARPVLNAGS